VTWLAILKAVLVAAGALLGWMKQRQLLDAGRAEAIAAQLKAALDEIACANEARDRVRRDLERNPSGVRDDDGFKRPD
jgi:hypothetical protein